MEHALYEELFNQETRHWWFLARRKIVISLLMRYLTVENTDSCQCKVLDVGCGCGANLEAMSRLFDATGVEPSFEGISYCRKRNLHVTKGHLPDKLNVPSNYFDAVTLIDVLEHIDNDAGSVVSIGKLLKPNGILLVTVPACQWLYTPRDAYHHHKRRYAKRQLHAVLSQGGLYKELLSYYNFYLFPMALIERTIKKIIGESGQGPDLFVPPAPVNGLFRLIFQSERHILPYISLPFGLSLIGVYRKVL